MMTNDNASKLQEYELQMGSYIKKYNIIDENNAGDAKTEFREEWAKLCPYMCYIPGIPDGASLFGHTLIKYSAAIALLPTKENISHLKELVESYDINPDCKYKMSIKEYLYLNLGLCLHKLGARYDQDAIASFKKYLLYLLEQSNHTSFSGPSAYGFR